MAKFAAQPVTMILQDELGQDIFWKGAAPGAFTLARASNALFGAEQPFVFANSAPANSPVVGPSIAIPDGISTSLSLAVSNPSTITTLSGYVYTSQTLNGTLRWALLAPFSIPKSADLFNPDQVFKVSAVRINLFGVVGESVAVVLVNNTALGAAEGFTSHGRFREI